MVRKNPARRRCALRQRFGNVLSRNNLTNRSLAVTARKAFLSRARQQADLARWHSYFVTGTNVRSWAFMPALPENPSSQRYRPPDGGVDLAAVPGSAVKRPPVPFRDPRPGQQLLEGTGQWGDRYGCGSVVNADAKVPGLCRPARAPDQ